MQLVPNKKPNKGKSNCYPISKRVQGHFKLRNLVKVSRKRVLGHLKLRNVVTIVCLIGCFIQYFESTEDYLSFQTRLTNEVKLNYESVTEKPAITVCIDKVINYTKLEEDFPDFRQEILKYNRSGLYTDPILQFPNVYKFLSQKIPDINVNKSIDYSVDLAKLIKCSLNNCTLNVSNQILSYNMGVYCLTTFSLNTNDPPFHQGIINSQDNLIMKISQMTGILF